MNVFENPNTPKIRDCENSPGAYAGKKISQRIKAELPNTPSSKQPKFSKRKLFSENKALEDQENNASKPSKSNSTSENATKNEYNIVPLSERQQIALLLQLGSNNGPKSSFITPERNAAISNLKARPPTLKARHLVKRNKRGETPLHLAAIKGDFKLVKLLIRQGAEVTATDFAGWTVLHEACNHGFYDIAQYLLKSGADANAIGYDNFTPLHDAAANGHSEVVKLLLQYGADPLLKNLTFKTASDLASKKDIVDLIEEHIQNKDKFSANCRFLSRKINSESSQSSRSSDHVVGTGFSQITMRKNSPQNQAYKGAEKPTSPRLTLRFQTIKTKDDKSPASGSFTSSSKANDVSSSQLKYPTYCVTMETRDSFQAKKEDVSGVSSSQTNPTNPGAIVTPVSSSSTPQSMRDESYDPVSSSSGTANTNSPKKDDDKMDTKDAAWKKLIASTKEEEASANATLSTSDKADSGENNGSKQAGTNVSSSRAQTVSTSEAMDYKSDDEKDESPRKRRKSSDTPSSKSNAPSNPLAQRQNPRGTGQNMARSGSEADHYPPPTLPLVGPQRPNGGSPKSLSTLASNSTPHKKKGPGSNPESPPQNENVDADKKASASTSSSSSSSETSTPTSHIPVSVAPTVQSSGSTSHGGSPTGSPHSPKVPPLKIVLGGLAASSAANSETENRERSKVSSSKPLLPYVISAPTEDGGSSTPGDSTGGNLSEEGTPVKDGKDGNKGGGGGGGFGGESGSGSGSSSSSGSTNNTPLKSKEEERFQRVTRSSQRMQAALANANGGNDSGVCSSSRNDHSGESSTEEHNQSTAPSTSTELHPRKRKLRTRDNNPVSNADSSQNNNNNASSSCTSSSSSSQSSLAAEDQQSVQNGGPSTHPQPQQQQQLLNCYQMFLNIRKQVDKRRKAMFVVHPKPPQGYKDYLLNRCSYVLEGNKASRISVPTIPPPQTLTPSMKELFIQQENERYKLRLQHLIEREKLVLSAEQEILRVHGRAARAMANQTVPLSACTILKDEEIYNSMELEQEDKDKNVRSRYNGRLFLSWLQDVDDKWEKIKEATLLRHHNEAESLHAVQKLDWEWKMKELAMCEVKSTPVIDDIYVPMVHVSDDFDLLPA